MPFPNGFGEFAAGLLRAFAIFDSANKVTEKSSDEGFHDAFVFW